jgi:hypothetical protein
MSPDQARITAGKLADIGFFEVRGQGGNHDIGYPFSTVLTESCAGAASTDADG